MTPKLIAEGFILYNFPRTRRNKLKEMCRSVVLLRVNRHWKISVCQCHLNAIEKNLAKNLAGQPLSTMPGALLKCQTSSRRSYIFPAREALRLSDAALVLGREQLVSPRLGLPLAAPPSHPGRSAAPRLGWSRAVDISQIHAIAVWIPGRDPVDTRSQGYVPREAFAKTWSLSMGSQHISLDTQSTT